MKKRSTNSAQYRYRVGVDENGLGARLGPLTVTAVLAEIGDGGDRLLSRRLPASFRADLDDSKALVSCHDVSLGEAWARVLVEREWPLAAFASPNDVFRALSIRSADYLEDPCPERARDQCWTLEGEVFEADDELLDRIRGHVATLDDRGVKLRCARTSVVCTSRLNRKKEAGTNRFSADLHEMEELVLGLRASTDENLYATLGKVGGMAQYGRFFGPLSGRLHTTLEEGAARSQYLFPGIGELAFVRDADAHDPLVMLASLVGKYLRELLMRRISTFYRTRLEMSEEDFTRPSGYHDPVTTRFVAETAALRKKLRVIDGCFERSRDEVVPPRARREKGSASRDQIDLFAE